MAKAKVSETITENIFRDFYRNDSFIEKSAIPAEYGFISKNKTSNQGYPDFFKDLENYEVFLHHGVIHTADIDIDGTVLHGDHRNVLFGAGFLSVGGQGMHLFTATDHGDAGIMDHANQVTAVRADVEFGFHFDFLLIE